MLYANNIAVGTYYTMSSKYTNNDENSSSRSPDSPRKVKKMAIFFLFRLKNGSKWNLKVFNESLMDRLSNTFFKLEKACFFTL